MEKSGQIDSARIVADKIFEALYSEYGEQSGGGGYFMEYAQLELLLGNKDKALQWLDKLLETDGYFAIHRARHSRIINEQRNNPEFEDRLVRMDERITEKREAFLSKQNERQLQRVFSL